MLIAHGDISTFPPTPAFQIMQGHDSAGEYTPFLKISIQINELIERDLMPLELKLHATAHIIFNRETQEYNVPSIKDCFWTKATTQSYFGDSQKLNYLMDVSLSPSEVNISPVEITYSDAKLSHPK